MAIQKLMESMSHQVIPASTLYVIGTPIGNMADISVRSLYILSIVDNVACEDTRVTGKLLSAYGLKKDLISAHQHNERETAEKLIALLKQGKRIALVSDAGTPGISDPGAKIVDCVRAAGLNVVPVPGPSAVITALSASGLFDDHFLFVGFLPTKEKQRNAILSNLKKIHATLVFYEAPHRILETIKAMAAIFEPERQLVIARELTKLFEEIHKYPLSEALQQITKNPASEKGEFVLLLESAPANMQTASQEENILSILLEELPLRSAVNATAKITGAKKKKLYDMALKRKADNPISKE